MAQAVFSDFETGVWSPAKSLVRVLVVMLGALSLSWAAAVNGQAFIHPDTVGYTRGPDVAIMKLLGPRFTTEWAQKKEGMKAAAPAAGHASAAADDKEVMGGRSIYYGVLAYLGAFVGGFWPTVFVQGLGVALLVEIALRGLRLFSLPTYAGVMALLAGATAAPFFVAFVMPDIWAGIAIGALATVFALSRRLSRPDTVLLGAMIVFAALAHSSVVPVLGIMLLAGGGLWLLQRGAQFDPRPGLAIGALALVIAVAGGMAFSAMVKHTVGKPPVNPPFMTARVIADGTGIRYLHDHCAGQPFAVCRYAARFPMDVDHFLWGTTDKDGVFQTVSADQRRALSDQDARFAVSVAAAYPVSQAAASLGNAALQIVDVDLSDFDYKPSLRTGFAQTLPAAPYAALRQTRAFAEAWPAAALTLLQSAVAIAALLLIGAYAARPIKGGAATGPSSAMILSVLVLIGVLANGAVCGVLSTLYGRYEARVVWLIPLAAALLTMARARARAWRA